MGITREPNHQGSLRVLAETPDRTAGLASGGKGPEAHQDYASGIVSIALAQQLLRSYSCLLAAWVIFPDL